MDCSEIYRLLDSITKISRVFINRVDDLDNSKKEIRLNGISTFSDGSATLDFYADGKKVKEYLFKAKNLIFTTSGEMNESSIKVLLENIENYDDEYIKFGDIRLGYENINKKIIITNDYAIVFEKK